MCLCTMHIMHACDTERVFVVSIHVPCCILCMLVILKESFFVSFCIPCYASCILVILKESLLYLFMCHAIYCACL